MIDSLITIQVLWIFPANTEGACPPEILFFSRYNRKILYIYHVYLGKSSILVPGTSIYYPIISEIPKTIMTTSPKYLTSTLYQSL